MQPLHCQTLLLIFENKRLRDRDKLTKSTSKQKTPKLGRYDSIANALLKNGDQYRVFVDISKSKPTNSEYEFVDLFAGAGGMTLGMEMAGLKSVAAVEMVEIASDTHKQNFPHCKIFNGDIAEFDTSEINANLKVRVVVGGPPCQGFSVAGKRDPNDPRNKLFMEFVRVVDELQPDYFVMENVPGILTMKNGKVRDAILEEFRLIGYENVSIAILEAASFGVAQIRARAIFIGNKHGMPNPFPAPIFKQSDYLSIESVISDLPPWDRVPEINHEWTRHSKEFTKRISKVAPGHSLYESFMDAYKRQYLGVPSMTIKENHGGTHIHPTLDRCISAREMARLQSFPDSFIFAGPMKKAMWQIGNAVAPLMAKSIGLALLPFLASLDTGEGPKFKQWFPDDIQLAINLND
jgi:DNA (cytosine-5)-methyltransferase 1